MARTCFANECSVSFYCFISLNSLLIWMLKKILSDMDVEVIIEIYIIWILQELTIRKQKNSLTTFVIISRRSSMT